METPQHCLLSIDQGIAHVSFNRPEKRNALHMAAWKEMQQIFEHLDSHEEVRAIVLSGEGKLFCSGIDLELLMSVQQFEQMSCQGRKREKIRDFVLTLQNTINAIERCRKPVLAAIHGGCIGGGVDIVAACDMRYCTEDAYFSIKEVDMGLVADLGTLQRLPKLISPAMVAEMAYTARNVPADEALKIGLVNRVLPDRTTLIDEVKGIAATIAAKSPLVIRGTKQMLLYSRDHTVPEALDYMATWNAAMFLSEDLTEAFQAFMQKRTPAYKD